MKTDAQINRNPYRKIWIFTKYLIVSCIVIFGSASLKECPSDNGDKNYYFLAFAEQKTHSIRVRYSKDGHTWLDGKFPDYEVNKNPYSGVSIASSVEGVAHLVVWMDEIKSCRALWGYGVTAWDNEPYKLNTRQELLSAPSVAFAGERIYLLAFKTEGSVLCLCVL